jgi:diguanylate cyclase (GGDEF)-like protein
VILIDLDRFKRINDRYGHDHGDAVLIEAGRRIQATMRENDSLARWGGEEFLAFLPGCPLAVAQAIGERMRDAIRSAPMVHEDVAHQVTATLGVATVGADRNFDAAIQRADTALYAGKQNGRDCVRVGTDAVTETTT